MCTRIFLFHDYGDTENGNETYSVQGETKKSLINERSTYCKYLLSPGRFDVNITIFKLYNTRKIVVWIWRAEKYQVEQKMILMSPP